MNTTLNKFWGSHKLWSEMSQNRQNCNSVFIYFVFWLQQHFEEATNFGQKCPKTVKIVILFSFTSSFDYNSIVFSLSHFALQAICYSSTFIIRGYLRLQNHHFQISDFTSDPFHFSSKATNIYQNIPIKNLNVQHDSFCLRIENLYLMFEV